MMTDADATTQPKGSPSMPVHQYRWTTNPFLARGLLALKQRGMRRTARLWGALLGIDAPGELPRSLALPHPYNIVVSADVRIGDHCVLYHGVTLGADDEGGVPTVGDRVEIYPGACVFGDVVLGAGSRIGANSVVLTDVPPGATAVGAPARIVGLPPSGDAGAADERGAPVR